MAPIRIAPDEVPPERAGNPIVKFWQTMSPQEEAVLEHLAELDRREQERDAAEDVDIAPAPDALLALAVGSLAEISETDRAALTRRLTLEGTEARRSWTRRGGGACSAPSSAARSEGIMDRKCDECVGTLQPVVLENFDFSAFAGIPVLLQETPGYRCSACNRETLDGEVINAVLHRVAREVVRMLQRLPGDHARFLRKHMRLSQKALAERMGIARETVAKWEIGETIISPQHDMMLRSIAATYLARSEQMPLTLVEMANVLDHVHMDEPLKTPPPFILDRALQGLRDAQTFG